MIVSIKKERLLLAYLRSGKKGAVRQWFHAYSPYLLKVALQKISVPEDAEEIVQETFINCLRQLPLFQEKSRLGTWMVGILRHEMADYYRKKYAKKALQVTPLATLIAAQPVKNASETSQKVKEVLSQMTRERRELLLLKYVDKHKVKEIAHNWRTTVKTIESELFRARQEFRLLYARSASSKN